VEAVNLNRLAYFAAVVDTGSFTRAAERLGVSKTVVSQQVARLESELRTSLLVRTTRRVEPTEAGRLLHARCLMIFREADEALGELAQSASGPGGTLRITAPSDYGGSVVAACAATFIARYPACRVELMLTDARLDLIQNQIDLSIRSGWLEDSSLQARRIGTFRQLLVASPAVVEALPATAVPKDISALPFVANIALKEPLLWKFSCGVLEQQVVTVSARMSADTTLAVHSAVRAGAGLSVLPEFLVASDLTAGHLVHVLPEWSLPMGGIHAVYPATRFRPTKVTAFVAILAEQERERTQRLDSPEFSKL